MKLYKFQEEVLKQTASRNRVAYYLDMGLGKTVVGSEKMIELGKHINLIICQKSKIRDWVEHLQKEHGDKVLVLNLTDKKQFEAFMLIKEGPPDGVIVIGVINYELAFRRTELLHLKDFTLMLDESSLISNEKAKRSKFVLRLKPDNVILLSGTPTSGRYERLWSQCQLLGWNISKNVFYKSYIITQWVDYGCGYQHEEVIGYKNVEHLKKQLREHGAVFLKTGEVLTLPEQIEQTIWLDPTADYSKFKKHRYLLMKDGTELIGDNSLTRMLYERQLCGQYHKEKLKAFEDLITSTEDNFVVFYNYTAELTELVQCCSAFGKRVGIVNGQRHDTVDGHDIMLVQYQAGAYGLNLQGFSHRIVYFTLPLGRGSCDMWEQSKKRIHRIGQKDRCFYYYLLVRNSIETRNLKALKEGKDFTDKLFERTET